MSVLMLGGSAIVPSLLLLWYVYARDKNPEPRGLLMKTFLLGAFICLPVVPVAMMLEAMGKGMTGGMWGSAFVQGFLGAGIPEEFFKFLVLRLFVWRQDHFDEPLDGVVYGATASLGFATLENILYVGEHGMGTAVLRALTAVPGHAFTGVVMGAFVGRARFAEPEQRTALIWTGLGSAMLLHGSYDAFLFTGSGYAFLALVVLFIEVRWGRKLYKALQAEQVVGGSALAMPVMAAPVAVEEQVMIAQGGWTSGPVAMAEREPERTFWSWMKLAMGGVGLSLCGIWWLAIFAIAFFPDSSRDVETVGLVGLAIISAIPTWICVAVFRSGLRGPFTPALG
ncbi:MAG: PrsW family glutamic-type intramembrane protease [Hyalangium sp.]|uniref:PrsW family glutamic-type intramembrane protease n=1 Tax=Hyalangium sp. TaxID=2028555 RepID=UPI00389B112E